jgi:hypothetical protein
MKTTIPWTTYRTRFLVKARTLTSSLTFTDSLGRQHSGRKGDYLVESSDGVLRIAPRQIFEDIYVPVLDGQAKAPQSAKRPTKPGPQVAIPPQRQSLAPLGKASYRGMASALSPRI